MINNRNSHPYDSGLIIADKNGAVEKWLAKEDERPLYYRNRVNAGLHVINPEVLALFGIDAEAVGKIGGDGKSVKVDLDRQLLKPLAGTGKMFCYDSPEYVKDLALKRINLSIRIWQHQCIILFRLVQSVIKQRVIGIAIKITKFNICTRMRRGMVNKLC